MADRALRAERERLRDRYSGIVTGAWLTASYLGRVMRKGGRLPDLEEELRTFRPRKRRLDPEEAKATFESLKAKFDAVES